MLYYLELQKRRNSMLLFMIGLARSGKSTWADKWLNGDYGTPHFESELHFVRHISPKPKFKSPSNPRVVVSGDDIRKALYGQRYNSHMEEYIFAIEHTMIKALLDRGHDVLVDDTHTT